MARRLPVLACLVALVALGLPGLAAQAVPPVPGDLSAASRDLQPVVIPGAQLGPLAVVANYVEAPPMPGCGAYVPQAGIPADQCPVTAAEEEQDGLFVPLAAVPGQQAGTPVGELAAYAWTGSGFEAIPFQVDERFYRYLTNHQSNFGTYSQADLELTYAFDVDGRKKEVHPDDPGHDPAANPARACEDPEDPTGMTSGLCDPSDPAVRDPVPGLDSDDEAVLMWRDAGGKAPRGEAPPGLRSVQEVRLLDPLDGSVRWVYVGHAPDGAPATASYVAYARDADADEFVKANRGSYGGAQGGGPCWTYDGLDAFSNPDGPFSAAPAIDADCEHRRPRDSATVTAQSYQFHYSGRWKMDSIRLADGQGGWGPDLVDRWKGRAFQLREDVGFGSSIAFEDETYWSLSSITLGERAGPVRVLRETWGADSGTPTTRLETFYAFHFEQLYHLRVHPIPVDGIYAFWDHNQGAVDTFYSPVARSGIAIDGVNDEAAFCNDGATSALAGPLGPPLRDNLADPDCPGDNQLFLTDVPDPSVQTPLSNLAWDQVAGPSGSMVTTLEAIKTMQSGALTTYYRDDARFDDGTGDDPAPDLQKAGCDPDAATCQGSFGAHGVHFFFTGDTDNLFVPAPVNEFVARTAQYLLPGERANVGEAVALLDRVPVVAVALDDAAGDRCAALGWAGSAGKPPVDKTCVGAALQVAEGLARDAKRELAGLRSRTDLPLPALGPLA